MGLKVSLCNTITTPDVFAKLGTSNQEIEKFLAQHQKIAFGTQINNDQIKKCCQNCDPKKYDQGIYIGPVNKDSIPHISEKIQKGIFLYEEGFLYFGQFQDGKRKGNGLLVNEEGDFYFGEWSENSPNGKGEYSSTDTKRSYKGEWFNGVQQGQGTQLYEDGSSYTGQFLNGLKHGYGKLLYPDGTFYLGQFYENSICGFGVSQSRFHKYQGEWANGKMHGNGISTWWDDIGQVIGSYVGQYKEGLKHGYGQYKWGEQRIYKGNWEEGDMKSQGVLLKYD